MATRKLRKEGREFQHLDFEGIDGKYYRCDKKYGAGLKEIVEFNKTLKSVIKTQVPLLDLETEQQQPSRKAPGPRPGVYH